MAQEGNRGTLSETERHWDNICVTLLTIATAALAAVLLVSGLGKPVNGSENLTGLTKATATGIAAGAYFILTVMVTKTVFTPSGVPPDQVAQWKKDGARNVFALFVNIALALAVVVFATIFSEIDLPWEQDDGQTPAAAETNAAEETEPIGTTPEAAAPVPSTPDTAEQEDCDCDEPEPGR